MGSYNGGGTIMKGGRFLSFDPADTGDRSIPRRKSVARNSDKKTIQKITAKKAKKKTASSKIKMPKDPSKLLESARKRLLNLIIDQMLTNRPEIKLPDQMHPDLNTAVTQFGNPVGWATQQSDFEQVQTKKIQLKTERELRQRARKRMQDEKTPFVVETKKAKTIHKPGSTGSGNPSVSSASANTFAIKTGALPPQKKKLQTAKLGDAGSPENRTLLICLLVDRLIQRKASATTPKIIDPILMAEIKEAGGNIPWLELQPSYPAMFAWSSAALKTTPKPAKNKFRAVAAKEDSTKLSEEQMIKRGQSRIVIHGKKRSSPDMDALIKRFGILPPPPVTPTHNNKKTRSRMTKAQKAWLSMMNRPQKDAWDKLLTKNQLEYVSFGKIHLGTPDEPEKPKKPKVAPLSDAPVSYIIAQVEKKSDEALDPKGIDWGST